MNGPGSGRRIAGRLAATALLALLATAAQAQQFHLYLLCAGEIRDPKGRASAAHLDLALRDNNMMALVQRSNLLPVGERMRYSATQTHYAMVYATPRPETQVHSHWLGTMLFVHHPEFRRVVETRLSVDRQSAQLEGEMMALNNELVGNLKMRCEPKRHDEAPAPKF